MRQPKDVTVGDRSLSEILRDHESWIKTYYMYHSMIFMPIDRDEFKMRAVLSYELLDHVNFTETDLRGANLDNANFTRSDFYGARLHGANLNRAIFREAKLCYANLSRANLRGADLRGADLTGANFSGAILYGANLKDAINVPYIPLACPERGAFIGYKAASDCLVCLEIPEDARRLSATTRKCRCDKAKVLDIVQINGDYREELWHHPTNWDHKAKLCHPAEVKSTYDPDFIYRVGETVKVDNFDEDRWTECSTGIHFFLNSVDAIKYHYGLS